MPKRFTFKGAYLRHGAMAIAGKDGAKTIRADFTVAWNAKVRSSLGWPDLADKQDSAHMDGSMSVMSIKLEVADKSFDLGSGTFKNFQAVRVTDKVELRGQYVTNMPTIMAKLESYVETTSRAKGDLTLTYEWVEEGDGEDEAKQPALDGMEEGEGDE